MSLQVALQAMDTEIRSLMKIREQLAAFIARAPKVAAQVKASRKGSLKTKPPAERVITEEGRRRMQEAQIRRWKKIRDAQAKQVPEQVIPKKKKTAAPANATKKSPIKNSSTR